MKRYCIYRQLTNDENNIVVTDIYDHYTDAKVDYEHLLDTDIDAMVGMCVCTEAQQIGDNIIR